MPIDIEERGDEPLPIRPDTNEEAVLTVLAAHPTLGFAPKELLEETDVPEGSIHKTLQRLVEKGLARKTEDGYYHVNADRDVVGLLRSLAALERMSREFEGDWFDRNPGWADDLPDLGPETVETSGHEEAADDALPTDDAPDLGTESAEESDP